MIIQKPAYEAIEPSFGNSFTYQRFDRNKLKTNNVWHYHPEIELVYVNGGAGKRQIGSNLSYYTDGTLILIGSNLPHCGFTDGLSGNRSETIIQMKKDFLGSDFFNIPEMEKIQNLFEIAKAGVVFSGISFRHAVKANGSLGSAGPSFSPSCLLLLLPFPLVDSEFNPCVGQTATDRFFSCKFALILVDSF